MVAFQRVLRVATLLLGVVSSAGCTTLKLDSPKQAIPRTFFGLHIHRLTSGTAWPEVSVPSWRLWDAQVKWFDLEPSRGQWRFDRLDKYVAMAEQHNTQVLLPLASTPQWASARPNSRFRSQRPGLAGEPKDMDDWRNYVRQVVTRYKGRISAYEIWNEPNLPDYWAGNTDQLIAMTKEAHDIIKSVDPSAIIVSPAATKMYGIPWLADFLRKGGARHVDVIGYHFYVYPDSPESLSKLIDRVKQTMKDNGVESKPIWGTELGWAKPKPFPSKDQAAAYLARSFILGWAYGLQRIFWYSWDNHDWVSLQTVEADDKTPTPAGQAYGTIQKWMVGASMDGCDKSDDDTWTCHMHRGSNSQWIVWNASTTKSFAVPASWHISHIAFLLQGTQELHDANIEVGPVPELLTQGDPPAPPNSLSASPRE
jgi:GH35 family endo-1,4-beta-xylanase